MSQSCSSAHKAPSPPKHALPGSHLTLSRVRGLGAQISILTLQTREMKHSAWNIMAKNHPSGGRQESVAVQMNALLAAG